MSSCKKRNLQLLVFAHTDDLFIKSHTWTPKERFAILLEPILGTSFSIVCMDSSIWLCLCEQYFRACPEVGLLYLVRLHWRKIISFCQCLSTADSFLVTSDTPSLLPPVNLCYWLYLVQVTVVVVHDCNGCHVQKTAFPYPPF